MKVACLVSGGKDSVYAAYLAMKMGYNVKYLLTVIPQNPESFMFHHPNAHLVEKQAEALGIPWKSIKTKGKKEEELEDLKVLIEGVKVDGIVSGAIASSYQKNRIDTICEELNLKSSLPLWGKEPEHVFKEILDSSFEIMVVSVSADGLDESWLGKIIDDKSFEELKKLSVRYKFNVAGEGGEFETFVLNAPFFKKRLDIRDAKKFWDKDSGYVEITI